MLTAVAVRHTEDALEVVNEESVSIHIFPRNDGKHSYVDVCFSGGNRRSIPLPGLAECVFQIAASEATTKGYIDLTPENVQKIRQSLKLDA
jgi:hypothetical protein